MTNQQNSRTENTETSNIVAEDEVVDHHLNKYEPTTLLFYQIEPYKKGPFLVLLSSIARNSSAPNAKRIF